MEVEDGLVISAEWPRVKLVSIKESEVNSKRTVIIRPPLAYQQRRLIQAIYMEYLGKHYDWAKYILWTMQISVVLAPLVYLAFLPLRRWLRKKERKYYDCVELVSTILERVSCPIGVDDLTYTWPDIFMMLAKAAPEEWEIVSDSDESRPS
jgi:hypothetical protein